MLKLDSNLPVLLLRTDHNVFHHGTLGAIRSLGRAGVQVHAMLEGGYAPAARSRHLHRAHPWASGRHTLLGRLEAAAEAIGRPALLVPMDAAGAVFVGDRVDVLSRWFLFPRPVGGVPYGVVDKAALAEWCTARGIAHPEYRVPRSRREVGAAVRVLGLPLIAKWARPWRLPAGSGLRGTTVVRSAAQACALFDAARPESGRLVLQRRIAPRTGTDWFFHGYFDRTSRCLFGATGRKELAHPPQAGHTVLGRWLPNPEVERIARDVAAALGHRGMLDLDLRLDPATGVHYLLDVNPRLGAQFRLFADEQGLDPVRAMHLDVSARTVPAVRPRHGRTFLVENHRLRAAAPWGTPRAIRAADELAWYAADDPAPFLAMVRRSLCTGLRRTFRDNSG